MLQKYLGSNSTKYTPEVLADIEKALAEGANPNGMASKDKSFLRAAINLNRVDVLKLLIAAGADVEKPDSKGDTPLYYAVAAVKKDAVQLLLAAGASPNTVQHAEQGTTPYLKAASTANMELIRMMVDADADLHATTAKGGENAVCCAARVSRTAEPVEYLLSKGVDPNTCGRFFFALRYAACSPICRDGSVIKALLAGGADPNLANADGMTALMACTGKAAALNAGLLIDAGANVNAVAKNGSTALHCALEPELTKLLLAKGAQLEAVDYNGATPLLKLSAHAQIPQETLEVLLDAGANINAKRKAGHTVLMEAASTNFNDKKSLEVVQLLLKRGADVNATTDNGSTALILAATKDRPDVVRALLDAGADINAKDKFGTSPLKNAVQRKCAKVEALLREVGATE